MNITNKQKLSSSYIIIKVHLKSLEETTNKLCELRLNMLKLTKSEPWTLEDLSQAVKDLDKNKSRDAKGYATELFKDGIAGSDLNLVVLKFMKHMKKNHEYP